VLATQNPIELEGTFPLPEAQIDRFMLRIALGYPSDKEEAAMLDRFRLADPLPDLQAVTTPEEVTAMQHARRQIRVDDSLRDYIVQVVRATRSNAEIQLGASPRASLALYGAAQAWAAMQGREYVLPDDVKAMAPHVLTHRMILSSQAQLRGRKPEELVAAVVNTVKAPVEAE
jgi:MoxR-like ATPase